VSAIIYDFKAIGAALRKQRIDDWWQPAKPEPKATSIRGTMPLNYMTRLLVNGFGAF
jgi:hypothetical protein